MHLPCNCAAKVKHPVEINIDNILPLLIICVASITPKNGARVVNQHINAVAEFIVGKRDCGVSKIRVANIADKKTDIDAELVL